MVFLGLGSNLGDRLHNLRKALAMIKLIPDTRVKQVSPLYLSDALVPEDTSPQWDQPFINLAIHVSTTLDPDVMLKHLREIETQVGRKPDKRRWGPRVIDIDIL